MSTNPTKQADELRAALARLDTIQKPGGAEAINEMLSDTAVARSAGMDVVAAAADVLDFAQLLDASPVVIPRARLAPLQIALSAYVEAVNAVADRHATP